ncbi:MAG: 2-C-methyl-D-erythritol 2,4-cyclodiphosphate synthase [Fimbriimonadales bacterium]|nr:2-C-methyl-D-erythritol 2,4-cyclodiphosphate synthase [Fimbriimonadales bacterium]
MVHALILAAGSGVRYGSEDKLWQPLMGKPLWWHAVWRLLTHPQVFEATLVVVPGAEPRFEAELSHPSLPLGEKVWVKGAGGATRQQSVRNGLSLVPPDAKWIAVHDAARPLVSHALLDRLFTCAREYGTAIPVLPLHDTLKRLTPAEPRRVEQTVPRERLYRVQTPQVFRADWLRDAHQRATEAGYVNATDDASLLEGAGYPVYTVPGDPLNLKITTPEDYTLLLRLMETPMQNRIGIGYDIHPLVEGRKLVLGGLEIEHALGLKGHSDADVVLHAICDALLGAAALGDIGQHFPNTDPRWQDVSSLELLQRVNRMLAEHGWQIAHIDATVLAEVPKLAPYVPAMRTRIAETLGIQQEQISLKATTNEGMDAVGERRAIACYAVATLQRPALFPDS